MNNSIPSKPSSIPGQTDSFATSGGSRIAWLHSHFLLWAGGTKFIYEVAKRVHPVIPVDLIVEKCSPELRKMFESEGMHVIEINTRSSTSMLYWLLFPYYLTQDIRRLRKMAPEYSACIASIFPMNFAAVGAGFSNIISYVLEPFAFFHDKDMIRGFPFMKQVLLRILSACYKQMDIEGVRNATEVMTINEGTAAWVEEIYHRQAAPSYLGVNTTLFSPKSDAKLQTLAAKYAGRKVVIHSTDWTPLKRTTEAVNAIAEIKTEVPEVLLLITQSSENRFESEKMKKWIHAKGLDRHVELLGFVSHEDLPYYYSLADISLYTGIGRGASAASLFVLECMACETPGVRTSFTHDEVEHDISGYLFDPEDSVSLQKYLIRILKDDGLRAKFGAAARQRILQRYSWEGVAGRFIEKIRSLEKIKS